MAGVPRASLVVIAATLSTFGIPEAGILLIMGIDQFLDMGRSATNVVGNSIATSGGGRWRANTTPRRPTRCWRAWMSPPARPRRHEGWTAGGEPRHEAWQNTVGRGGPGRCR